MFIYNSGRIKTTIAMIEIGKFNYLRIVQKTDVGVLLTDGDTEVMMPYNHAPNVAIPGDNINVFTFMNKEGKLLATNQTPYATVGEFAFLEVVDVSDDGAYLDLGIDKDLYAPKRDQKRPMQKGESYVVYVYLDESNGRMLASSRVANYVEEKNFEFEELDEVSLLISEETDLGFNAIINNQYIGLLYHNEVFDNVQPGDVRKGWIKKIRVEGKIDLTLQPTGYGHILDTKDVLLQELKKNNGLINLGDKSSPLEIYERFKISKNAFRKSVGGLYKERLVTVSDYEIRLVAED
ncbi:hypothetical protein ADIARSV_2537 [Arcticibacter svalbardensis MN12-7]|uniref:S1 motif domain-containing protein n=2 Tax=Arcticibacter TaxID=1288026 RepID=R9GRF5_9SPHI|nr:hypothetical protein ADIARSV_2537 [Arcticibacter svalbardensis MN12-7]